MASDKCFTVVEQSLSDNLDKLRNYFYNCWLKLNTTKTVCRAFHLTSALADYELSITTIDERIPLDRTPKYLVVTFNHTLSYHQHLINTTAKVSKQCNLLKRHASNHWRANFTTLRTSTLALCFSVPEYCCLIWSQNHHFKNVDTYLNGCLRLVSGCIKSTPAELLKIEPVDIRRNKNIWVSIHVWWKALTFFTRSQYLHLSMLDSKAECHYKQFCTILSMIFIAYLLETGPSMLGEDDEKILNTSSIILLHSQALNQPGVLLSEVNKYCSIDSGLVMVNTQASCIELVFVRMQIVYVVQFKLLNTYWIAIW